MTSPQRRLSAANLELVGQIRSVAARHDATPSQVALAWVRSNATPSH